MSIYASVNASALLENEVALPNTIDGPDASIEESNKPNFSRAFYEMTEFYNDA